MPGDDEALDPLTGLPLADPPTPAPPAPVVPPVAPPLPAPAPVATPAVATPAQRRAAEEATASDIRKREQRKLWREEYGTDDEVKVAEIKAQRAKALEEHGKLIADEEKRKREQMSEVERLTKDCNDKDARIAKLEADLERLKADKVAAQQDLKIRNIAVKYISLPKLKYAIIDFGEYVRALTKADAAKLDEIRIGRWFQKFAQENPDMAAGASSAPAPAVAKPKVDPVDPPAGNLPAPAARPRVLPAGARRPAAPAPAKPNGAPDPLAGKTPRPGLPNSMNRQELAEHMRRQGLRPL